MKSTNKLVRMALLLSFALVINYLESLIPLPIPLPGVKIGLANCIGLMVLYCFEEKSYISFNLIKVLMVALVRTGLGTAFFISFIGTLLSTIATILIYKFSKASIYGLSIIGALFHSLGQVIMVMILYSNIYMINYLPILEVISIVTGCLTAFISANVLIKLPKKVLMEDKIYG
jgi:heptaprenyl diphosphate synthase